MGGVSEIAKPHAVFIPFPAQGHISAMIKAAKLLHCRGFHVTFVNTEYNHKRLLKARGPDALNGLPDFCFEAIPDGLPPADDIDATQDIPSLCVSIRNNCSAPFRGLLSKLNASTDIPPVSCVVSDGAMSFTAQATEELGIPNVFFWTTSACSLLGFAHFSNLVAKGYTPLKDSTYLENGYLDTVIDWIPGLEGIQLRDLPSFIRTTDPNEPVFNYIIREMERASKASAIILNTFDDIDQEVVNSLSSMFPPIYTIGPLPLILNNFPQNGLETIGSSLWKEDPECLQWLNSRKSKSVVYVNFGSITVMTAQQMTEFAWGLANSKQTFLWIIRPDLVTGESAIVPSEFVEETKDRGLLASWCPQEQVLNHPSIGGFLTHNGWNSTIESIGSGVSMVCWPFFADQQTNCWIVCNKWGIGREIDNNVKREEVEKLVRELMEGQTGTKMRSKAMEWKMKAEEATSPNGSSYLNLEKVINEVLLT